MAGAPIRPVVLEGLTVTPYIADGPRPKIAYSLRCTGLVAPGRRSADAGQGGLIMAGRGWRPPGSGWAVVERAAPLGARVARPIRRRSSCSPPTVERRHVRPGVAWVRPCARPGWYWLDADALAAHAATRTGEERRVLLLWRRAARRRPGDPATGRESRQSAA